MNDLLIYIQAIIFLAYITFLQLKFGTLQSISQSYYELKSQGYLFVLFCFGIGIPMIIQSNGNSSLFFLSGAGLLLVGMASKFGEKMTKTAHYVGAGLGIVSALLAIGVVGNFWWPMLFTGVVSIGILLSKVKSPIYWIEIVSFVAIVAGLLFI